MANRFLSNIKINDAYTFPASDGTSGQFIATDGAGNLSFQSAGEAGATVIYKDLFTGNASTVVFTLANSVDNEVKTQVYFDGVYQSKENYTVSGNEITFSTAPPSGAAIEVITFATVAAADYNQKLNFYGKAVGAIAKGDAVMFAGAQGDHFLITKATQASLDANHEYFLGLAAHDFVNNQYGYVTQFGRLEAMDTSDYIAGDILWFDSAGTVAGALTTTPPSAPNTKIQIAAVVRVHQNEGVIFVRPTVYHEISELHDVSITSAADKDLLSWNATLGVWENTKTLGNITTGNITTSGTVDGVDVSLFKSDYDTHNHDSRYYTETEIDTLLNNKSNWDTAYGWGDHSLVGYLTSFTETDPIYTASSWYTTTNNSGNWNTAFGWGNHATAGYLTSFTETDPIYTASSWYTTPNNSANWDTAYGWGNHTGLYSLTGHTHDLIRHSLAAPAYIDGMTSTTFRTSLFGSNTNGYAISTSRWNTTPAALSGMNSYGTLFAWSGSDTHGFIATDYSTANIQVGGGYGDNITWKATLIHSSNIGSQSVNYANSAGTATDSSKLPLTGGTLTGTLNGTAANFTNEVFSNYRFRSSDGTASFSLGHWDGANVRFESSGRPLLITSYTTDIKLGMSGSTTLTIDSTSIKAPIFYDSNNTGYYVDPASTSSLNIVNANGFAAYAGEGREVMTYLPSSYTTDDLVSGHEYGWYDDHWRLGMTRSSAAPGADFVVQWNGSRRLSLTNSGVLTMTGRFFTFAGSSRFGNILVGDGTYKNTIVPIDDTNLNINTPSGAVYFDTYTVASGSHRAPIFYDSNNTAYYVDPAGTSNINAISVNGYADFQGDAAIGGGSGYGYIKGYSLNWNHMAVFRGAVSGSTSSPTITGSHNTTFIEYAENNSTTGWFFKSSSTGTYEEVAKITRDFASFTQLRAPIFYDSNDTAYYVNPDGNSRLYSVDSPQGYVSNGNPWGTSNSAFFPNGITTAGGTNWIYGSTYIGNAPSNGSGHQFFTSGSSYSTGDMEAGQSMRAPIFYDRNDTSYYIDGTSESQLAKLKLVDATYGYNLMLGPYTLSRTQNDTTRHGIVINADYYPHIDLNATSSSYVNPTHGAAISMTGLIGGGFRRWGMGIAQYNPNELSFGYHDNESNPHYGIGINWTYPAKMWIDTAGDLYSTGSMRSPIFYDSGNTSYYINADSTSNLYNLELGGAKHTYLYITPGNGYEAMVRFNGGSGSTWYVGSRTSTDLIGSTDAWHVYSQTAGRTVSGTDTAGNIFAYGSHRAPIFLDSNNTAYFLNPDTTGVSLKIKGGIVTDAPSGSVLLEHQVSEANAWIFKENATNWGLYWFNAGSESGQGIGSYTTVGAELFGMNNAVTGFNPPETWAGIDTATRAAWMLSNNSGYFWSQGTQYSETDMRAPIFYDTNTAYYVDPASTSNLARLQILKNNVGTDIASACIYLDNASGSNGTTYNMMSDVSTYFGSRHIGFLYNGVVVGHINAQSTTSVAYNTTSSDLRLKKNISDWQENVLDSFALIEPKEFNFNFQEEGERKDKGFIAQEMVDKFPEAYPHDYSTDNGDSGYYSFNPSGMVVYLMKALKEQTDLNKSFAATIEDLKTRIQTLENGIN